VFFSPIEVTKAAAAAKAQQASKKKATKVYTTSVFRRPHTLRVKKSSKYVSKIAAKEEFNAHAVIKAPVFTDAAMKQMERANSLTFTVDMRSNKAQIKAALKKLHNLKVVRVNTLITKRGVKKAYCRLDAATSALSAANTLGLI
jgi:large subunit ribosomal protein L23Ae